MNKTFFILLLCVGLVAVTNAQSKWSTKTGNLVFEASVPSFEEVKATNNSVSAILNTETGAFASLALVKGFRFKVALMEEHFNENYMESSDFPKAVCKGKLVNFNVNDLKDTFSDFTMKGTITMHGVTKPIETIVKLKKTNNEIELQSNFILKPEDFDIKIPGIVSKKIADEVNVSANYSLSQ